MNERDKTKCLSLYNDWKQRKLKEMRSVERKHQETDFMSNITHTDSKSREINSDLLKKIFSKIFNLLINEQSIIDGNNFDLSKLPDKISVMITPLLNELRQQNETLTLEEFILACGHIYAFLPFDEKQLLNEWYFSMTRRKPANEAEFTFKVSTLHYIACN